ncbi:hypothetical protein L3X38_010555 [Prunus dulcis]|uniref:Uncharacterized protein n=1 Tax=Prunus dulcis TaxID=3755 RepID=A0AAD4WHC8_PRUDU|nr:hypothetical protein L3X38_010555 [Prunus dulcis]
MYHGKNNPPWGPFTRPYAGIFIEHEDIRQAAMICTQALTGAGLATKSAQRPVGQPSATGRLCQTLNPTDVVQIQMQSCAMLLAHL